jgi:hypothetical protein
VFKGFGCRLVVGVTLNYFLLAFYYFKNAISGTPVIHQASVRVERKTTATFSHLARSLFRPFSQQCNAMMQIRCTPLSIVQ